MCPIGMKGLLVGVRGDVPTAVAESISGVCSYLLRQHLHPTLLLKPISSKCTHSIVPLSMQLEQLVRILQPIGKCLHRTH